MMHGDQITMATQLGGLLLLNSSDDAETTREFVRLLRTCLTYAEAQHARQVAAERRAPEPPATVAAPRKRGRPRGNGKVQPAAPARSSEPLFDPPAGADEVAPAREA